MIDKGGSVVRRWVSWSGLDAWSDRAGAGQLGHEGAAWILLTDKAKRHDIRGQKQKARQNKSMKQSKQKI